MNPSNIFACAKMKKLSHFSLFLNEIDEKVQKRSTLPEREPVLKGKLSNLSLDI